MTADSSPLITRYVCTDGAEEGTEFYHATPASDAIEGKDSVRLTEGTWEITAIPIINQDGSITTPSGGGEQAVPGDHKGSGSTDFTGETKPAGDVTQDDIDKVLDKVNEAVSKGDGTLTGGCRQGRGEQGHRQRLQGARRRQGEGGGEEGRRDRQRREGRGKEGRCREAVDGSSSAPFKSDSKPSSGSTSKPSHEHTCRRNTVANRCTRLELEL